MGRAYCRRSSLERSHSQPVRRQLLERRNPLDRHSGCDGESRSDNLRYWILDTEQHVSQLGIDNSSARVLPAGTVCLSRTASVGFVVTMGVPMSTSQDFVNWVCGPDLIPRTCVTSWSVSRRACVVSRSGRCTRRCTIPTPRHCTPCCPPGCLQGTQDAIAEVLGALDDKIAANDRNHHPNSGIAQFGSVLVDAEGRH